MRGTGCTGWGARPSPRVGEGRPRRVPPRARAPSTPGLPWAPPARLLRERPLGAQPAPAGARRPAAAEKDPEAGLPPPRLPPLAATSSPHPRRPIEQTPPRGRGRRAPSAHAPAPPPWGRAEGRHCAAPSRDVTARRRQEAGLGGARGGRRGGRAHGELRGAGAVRAGAGGAGRQPVPGHLHREQVRGRGLPRGARAAGARRGLRSLAPPGRPSPAPSVKIRGLGRGGAGAGRRVTGPGRASARSRGGRRALLAGAGGRRPESGRRPPLPPSGRGPARRAFSSGPGASPPGAAAPGSGSSPSRPGVP